MCEATPTITWGFARTRFHLTGRKVEVESREMLSGARRKPRRNRCAGAFLVGRHAVSNVKRSPGHEAHRLSLRARLHAGSAAAGFSRGCPAQTWQTRLLQFREAPG